MIRIRHIMEYIEAMFHLGYPKGDSYHVTTVL